MKIKIFRFIFFTALALSAVAAARAWDYEGHRAVNQLALAALPTNFPAFALTPEAKERVAFLAGEPDRWRNMSDELALANGSNPDHYLDLEDLADYGLTPQTLPVWRYDFAAKLAVVRAEQPAKFRAIDPLKNKDHTRELIGFLPWAIAEYQGKLKSGFSYLKAFQEHGGTPEEIANAQANILYIMGVMGHFVGDASQPLHTTKHHHGWLGDNPQGYTTDSRFHSWVDGGYFKKTGGINVSLLAKKIRPAKIVGDPTNPDGLFKQMMIYLGETNDQVVPLYELQKDNKLSGDGGLGTAGRPFMDGQLVKGGQMLGDLWFSAWQQATEDKYLIGQLIARQAAQAVPVEKSDEKK